MSDIRERDERFGPGTYMTPEEAKEFHKLFVVSFILFTIIAIVAHVLAWMWRPWLPGETGYAAVSDTMQVAQTALIGLI